MATAEEIMLTFMGKDMVSNVTKGIDGNVQSMASNVTSTINSMNAGLRNISDSANGFLSGLTGGKTASEVIFGTSSKAETNKVLLNNMTETAAGAEKLYKTVDSVTDKSLTSMQELIPAMNAFKAATGASDDEMNNVTEGMANFGAAVLAQTGSTERAQTAMMDLSKGIKGAFASLDQYGISEDALMRTGLWSGKEDDVEGYMAAVTEVIGSTEELMNTNEGLDAQLGKAFSRAGKKIGNEFLPVIKDVKRGFLELDNALGGNLSAGILVGVEGIEMLSQGFYNLSNVVQGVKDVNDAWKTVSKIIKDAGKVEKVADGVGGVVEGASSIGALAPEAAAASAETATFSSAFAGFGASLGAMLAPLLMIAAVVAIMIPVVAGLAAEALLFVRAIAEVIKALDFDSLDLSGAIDGIKQIGSAMWELFKAMGAMTLLSGATILYQVSSIFLGLQNPVRVAVDEIKKAVSIINELGSVGNIDESIPGKMQSLGTTLQSVSEAFRSMQTVVGDVLWGGLMTLGGLLGSFTDNLLIAKTELTNAFNELNTFNIGSVDEGVANNLKSVAETLKAVSDAFGALSDITWDVSMENLLTLGGKIGSISTSLTTAKDDIVEAANTINGFTGLPTIDESITSSLQNVSKGITSVADTLGALQKINDAEGFDWTDWGKDFTTDVQNAREDIENAAKELKKFENLPEVPDVHDKLNNVGKAAAQATNTLKALNGIPPVESADVTSKIIQARYAISNAAIHLKSLEGIAEVPDLTEKLNNVGKAAATATNTTKALSMLASMEINAADVNTKVQQARYAISNAAIHLASLAGIATIPDNLSETLTRVGNATVQVKGIATNLSSFPTVDPAVSQSVANAVTVIKDIITQLNTLAGASLTDVGGLLSSINNAIAQMKATLLAASTGFYASGVSIGQSITNGVGAGLSGLNSAVSGPMNSAMSTMISIGQSGGNRAGTATTNAFRSTLKLGTVMTTEMGYVKQAVDNGISAAVTAARNGAEDVVQAFKDGINTGSPGDIAWTMHDEMWYTHDFIVSEGKYLVSAAKQLGQDVVTGFGNPTLKTNFGPLGGGDFNRSVIASIETMNSKAPAATSSPVQIIIQEGAIQLDARNLTTQESKQVVINALEGLDCISNIDIRGM